MCLHHRFKPPHRKWYVLSCLWQNAHKRSIAVNGKNVEISCKTTNQINYQMIEILNNNCSLVMLLNKTNS